MKTIEVKSLVETLIRQEWLAAYLPYILVVVFLTTLPAYLPEYLQSLMTKGLIFAIFAMSTDLLYGYTGLLTLGHAAFFGMGGYAGGILITHFGVMNFWAVAAFGVFMAALLSVIFGYISLRVSGLYFLMVTFGLGMLLYALAFNWQAVTGGSFGLRGIARPDLGIPGFIWDTGSLYFFILVAFFIAYFLLHRIVNSPFGHVIQGIRENELRMRVMGYNTWRYQYVAFILGGSFAGFAGVLFILWNGMIHPNHVGFITSAYAQLYVILGGAGTIFGPAIGAIIVVLLEFFVSMSSPERWPLIIGAIFLLSIMFLQGGIAPHLVNVWKKAWGRSKHGSTAD